MKSTRLIAAIALLATLINFGCKKSKQLDNVTTYTPQLVTATLSGRVVDGEKAPVSGATVKVGALTAITDVNGMFSIANASVDKNAGFVRVEKDSFFLGTRTIVIQSGKDNKVDIQLIKKTVAGTFKGADGGTVSVPAAGGSIVFPSGSIMNSTTKAPYTGTVTVSAFYYNPTQTNFTEIIPGSLRGLNANNLETGLQSFSMMAVELSGAAGEKLQLVEGKPATITFPIPAGLLGQAPATIPLWYLDETNGLWREEGNAIKQGNNYIGQVKHFSFWNCDAPLPLVGFSAVIKNQQGALLTNGIVEIRAVAGATDSVAVYGSGYINTDGTVSGGIPANRALTMIVRSKCGFELYRKNIGPFAADIDLGVVIVTAVTPTITFSGTAVNCDDLPVTNGVVKVQLEDGIYSAKITNGTFNISVQRCSAAPTSAAVLAYDLASGKSSTATIVAVTDQPVIVGKLIACSTLPGLYINYTINGVQYSMIPPSDSLSFSVTTVVTDYGVDTTTRIRGIQRSGSDNSFALEFKGLGYPGVRQISRLVVVADGKGYVPAKSMTVNVTEYGYFGGATAGIFTGEVQDSTKLGVSYPFTCTFRAKR